MSDEKNVFATNDAAAQKTIDGFENFAARVGTSPGTNNVLSQGFFAFNLITKNRVQLEAAYRGSWVVGKIIDSKAEDMVRAGVNIVMNDESEKIPDMQAQLKRLKIFQSLCSILKWASLYGGAIGVLQIKGQRLDTPLDPETIGKDQFTGITVFDRWQVQPSLEEIIEEGPDLGLPKYYRIVTSDTPTGQTVGGEGMITGIAVHHTRCIRMIGIELPYWQAIIEQMWGESELERLWDRLISFDTATLSSANLINRANLRTVQVEGLREIIAAGGKALEGLYSMFDMMRELQTNEGLTLLDKNDAFASTAYSFAGLSDMLLQYGQQISGASEIPLVRLFGQSPAGLNSSGDSDLRTYYDGINADQEADLRNPFELILKILYRSMYGKAAPADMTFTFASLWQNSEMDQATIMKTNAETISGVFADGIIDKPTAMKELKASAGDSGLFSNITDEAIEQAEEEPAPDMPIELENTPTKKEEPTSEEKQDDKEAEKNPAMDSHPFALHHKILNWIKRK